MSHDINYRILKLLAAQPNLSQRALAGSLGISLGRTNYALSELIEKGIIKMKRLESAPQKISYAYLITPKGLEEKSKIAAHLLKQKQAEYEQIKGRIKEITEELEISSA
ncbi:MAG: MarR family EPS-associated transcriptional regulator [Deltaproteobacteria bacterium]|nr:MarR family EPS-associated transcriptional regulator [Deltaproteobacteria bacterium]